MAQLRVLATARALWQPAALKLQYNLATKNHLAALLTQTAIFRGLPPAFLLAVASRETGIRNILGDQGHGHGILQIDDRWHPDVIALNPDWGHNPETLVDYGAQLLADHRKWAERNYPELTRLQHLKIAASAYNAGRGGAAEGVKLGNSDLRTTGRNYGADVLKRAAFFAALRGETWPPA